MIRESQAYWLRAVGLWVLLMAAETLQGVWRVKVLAIWLGDKFARDVGVFTGSLIILLITFACIGWIPRAQRADVAGSGFDMGGLDHRLRTCAGTLCIWLFVE